MLIREPSVAGQFYPANPKELRRTVEAFFLKSDSLLEAKAVVVPHAGYIYSGAVAGKVFSAVRIPQKIILLGPNHSGRGESLALSPEGAWRMPSGIVGVDEEMNQALLAACSNLREDSAAHSREHSLEVQIPFIQAMQTEFRFSAICVGTARYSMLEELGHGMARVIQSENKPVLMVASSDMTHYESADTAAGQDRFAIDRILAVDPEGLYRVVLDKDISMCGFAPTVAVLVACRALGVASGRLIEYSNSGVASGDYDRVVAYAGIALA